MILKISFLAVTFLVWTNDAAETHTRPPPRPKTTDTPPTSFSPSTTQYGEVSFPWQAGDDPLDYYIKYCSWTCFGTSTEGVTWNPDCYPCSCTAACQAYGTCCPENYPEWARRVFANISDSKASTNLATTSNINPESSVGFRKIQREQIVCEEDLFSYSILMVSRCPFSEVNNSLIDLCEADLTFAVDRYTPVSNEKTGVTYRNIFCLQCSLEKDKQVNTIEDDKQYSKPLRVPEEVLKSIQKWVLKISCEHYQSLYFVTTEDDFLRKASEQVTVCDVKLLAPEDLPEMEQCDPQFFWPREKRESTECHHSDNRLTHLCSAVDQLAFSTSHKGQNLFCMLCDGETPYKFTALGTTMTTFPTPAPTFGISTTSKTNGPVIIPPLSLLLGVSGKGQPQLPKCSNITWWDDSRECRPAHCSAGKLIDESGKCLSVVEQIRGLGYKLSIVFQPRKQEMVTIQDIKSLSNYISSSIAEMSIESMSEINITVVCHDNCNGSFKLSRITVFSYFIGNDTIGRDEYEDQLLSFFSQTWIVPKANGTDDSMTLKPVLLGEELRRFEEIDIGDVQEITELPQKEKTGQGSEKHEYHKDDNSPFRAVVGFTTPPLRRFFSSTMPLPISFPPLKAGPSTSFSTPSGRSSLENGINTSPPQSSSSGDTPSQGRPSTQIVMPQKLVEQLNGL